MFIRSVGVDLFRVSMQCHESDRSPQVRSDAQHLLFFTNLFLTASCLTLDSLSSLPPSSSPLSFLTPLTFRSTVLFSPFFLFLHSCWLSSLSSGFLLLRPPKMKKHLCSDLLTPVTPLHALRVTCARVGAADCSESSSVTSSLGEEWFKTDGPLLRQQPGVNSSSSWIKS